MKITDKMIEAGGMALAEWSAPNYGKENWGRSPVHNAYREMAKLVLEAALAQKESDDGQAIRD